MTDTSLTLTRDDNTLAVAEVLDHVQLRDDSGDVAELSAEQKLTALFGSTAPAAHAMLSASVDVGFQRGLVASTPGSDRTDILANALRRIHVKEMFGDCEEDGDPYPCRTIRALDMVAGVAATDAEESADIRA